ncbi:glycoside hydrolase family 3 N-terminal domain-containing protein [Rufibacter psychrotolerans]|uniref:glycoside hydrolase family 3 N-terminal domain-containing protein n=1 Tax=Rufibacter psychrotolerans TaxID=2812556 RepID=UPI001966F1B0|nr:glycoside hydrolase family 3 N-terminal domain-containing protein [Rufibacter sp. SYSU D00308]
MPAVPVLRFSLLVYGLAVLVIGMAFSACKKKDPHAEETVVFKPEPISPEDTINYPNELITTLHRKNKWVDSVFRRMTPDERITQLMMVEVFSNQGPQHEEDVLRLIRQYKVGGLIFFQGGPVRQAKMTNRLQAASKIPLWIGMDAENGIGMRMDSAMQYPLPMLLGAINNDSLIYRMGAEMAFEFKRLGMHLNFAPVVDVNNNPQNPIISYRAFGENKDDVSSKSLAQMQGMQDNGIIATAKHFPGHGDTDVDSHYDLPVIPYGRNRLDSLELYPFRHLIQSGVGGIMVGHIHLPKLDSTPNLPASLSKPIVTGILKEELGYGGLIVTDAMVMKGVTKYFAPGEAEVMALEAGNDVLERLVNVPKALAAIKAAIRQGRLSQQEIDRRCKKVLAAKYWVGLHKYQPIKLENLYQDLHAPHAHEMLRHLAEGSLTLLHNKRKVLPLENRKRRQIASLAVGGTRTTFFQKKIKEQLAVKDFFLPRRTNKKNLEKLRKELLKYDLLLISIYGPSIRPSNNLGFAPEERALVDELVRKKRSVVVLFDNAYTLNRFQDIHQATALVVGYQQLPAVQAAAAKLIMGDIKPQGKLPVTVNKHFKYGDGL